MTGKLNAARLRLPENWQVEERPDRRFGPLVSHWRANPSGDDQVWLGCYARMCPGSAPSEKVKSMLTSPPHELNDLEKRLTEHYRIGFPFEDNEPFDSACTAKFGSFTGIALERHWNLYQKRTYEVIIDPRQTALASFHFYYAAPDALFDKYWPIVHAWLTSEAPVLVAENYTEHREL